MSNINNPPPPPYIEEPLPAYTPDDPNRASHASRSSSLSSNSSSSSTSAHTNSHHAPRLPSYASVTPTPEVRPSSPAVHIPALTPPDLIFARTLAASRAAPLHPTLLVSSPAAPVLSTNTITWPLTMPRRVPVGAHARHTHVAIDMPESASESESDAVTTASAESEVWTTTTMTESTTARPRWCGWFCTVVVCVVFVGVVVVGLAFLIKWAGEEASRRDEVVRTHMCTWRLERCP